MRSSILALGIAYGLLVSLNASAQNGFVDCSVSGQPADQPDVIASTTALTAGAVNSIALPSGQCWYYLKYDANSEEAKIFAEGDCFGDQGTGVRTNGAIEIASTDVIQSAGDLSLPGFYMTFSGGTQFGSTQGSRQSATGMQYTSAAYDRKGIYKGSGSLVDADRDGSADEIMVRAEGKSVPDVLGNITLEYRTANNQTYWYLPLNSAYGDDDKNLNYYVPVDPATNQLWVECAGQRVAISGKIETPASVPVPTATFWGYAFLLLSLLVMGALGLRRGGFAQEFRLRD